MVALHSDMLPASWPWAIGLAFIVIVCGLAVYYEIRDRRGG